MFHVIIRVSSRKIAHKKPSFSFVCVGVVTFILQEKTVFCHLILKKSMLMLMINFGTLLIGTEGMRLLREKRVKGRPHRRAAEEAPGPPAESERLEWKSTG
ncbi:hypothetical protein CWS01_14215 [Niallia nealsonii]|uniref:Uncharacterized protein n=1 Tax=Niallia nealsonii TaxID=115979 RepID=A0A2N0YZZ7_9BACI|nr:hypothetical protein CWS01_14215 [Niallia nealsonii]